jgi:hypothetical protein
VNETTVVDLRPNPDPTGPEKVVVIPARGRTCDVSDGAFLVFDYDDEGDRDAHLVPREKLLELGLTLVRAAGVEPGPAQDGVRLELGLALVRAAGATSSGLALDGPLVEWRCQACGWSWCVTLGMSPEHGPGDPPCECGRAGASMNSEAWCPLCQTHLNWGRKGCEHVAEGGN